ncbi:hypothetical protein ACFQRC_03850 [Enterovirga sp. GCM10030262]|uniref:hypothetical protein n=1 Tax=Enterovirga sp. GCM10030262 TaxID=3273391 RepID=UPI0036144D13
MHEQFDSRLWAEHGSQISASIAEAFRKLGEAFKTLNRIAFDAPWRRDSETNETCAHC